MLAIPEIWTQFEETFEIQYDDIHTHTFVLNNGIRERTALLEPKLIACRAYSV